MKEHSFERGYQKARRNPLTRQRLARNLRAMTDEQLSALTAAVNGKVAKDGWTVTGEGQLLTLYVAHSGASLTVSRINAFKVEGGLLLARTLREEQYALQRATVFAGATDSAGGSKRTAGFV